MISDSNWLMSALKANVSVSALVLASVVSEMALMLL